MRTEPDISGLFERFGYTRYKMNKFEEYDLYATHRSFITGGGILTFTDTDGRLRALKPDVTLSIIRDTPPSDTLSKLYYNESVYRADRVSGGFREIRQTGLECIGNLTTYTMAETVLLACGSLRIIDERFMLDISQIGLLSGFFEDLKIPENIREDLLKYAQEKNSHDAERLCLGAGVDAETTGKIKKLITLRGPLTSAIEELCGLDPGVNAADAVGELAAIAHIIRNCGWDDKIYLDLSLTGDPDYYNGVLIKGYVPEAAVPVLSGGRYDGLMRKFGKDAGAMGFAVYLSYLDRRETPELDVLIIDDGTEKPEEICRRVSKLTKEGKSVRVDTGIPDGIVFKQIIGGERKHE